MSPFKQLIVVFEILCFILVVHSLPFQATMWLGQSPARPSRSTTHCHKVRSDKKYASDIPSEWKPQHIDYYTPTRVKEVPPTNGHSTAELVPPEWQEGVEPKPDNFDKFGRLFTKAIDFVYNLWDHKKQIWDDNAPLDAWAGL
jgi:hypothetical protein